MLNALTGMVHHPATVMVKPDPKEKSESGISLIIAEGNEHPIHPDWLRSLRDQCLAANVEFNFASHGQWLHMSQFPTGTNDLVGIETTGPMHSFHAKVGRERSGRLLDGQEHNGRIV